MLPTLWLTKPYCFSPLDDRSLINQANVERRILLTEDKDFGWLVFVSHEYSAGVLLLRFPGDKRKTMAEAVVRIIREQNEKLLNTFAVVQPGYVRINRKPQDSHE